MGQRPVVVTGLGVICAAGRDTEEFWARLMSGQGAITPLLAPEYAFFEAPHAGQVPDEWLADDGLDGLDRSGQLAVVAAVQALAHGGIDVTTIDPARFGIVLGRCQATETATGDGQYAPMHETADVLADRFGSTGPRVVISTACAAGGNAVGLARDKILTGEADIVLAGGVDPLLRGTFAGFAGLQALKSGPCAPYSLSDGLNLGEGAAFLLVEPLDRALARGVTPLAEVAGYGLSADAYHATAPDPTGRGGANAALRAFTDAGIAASDVDYVNGHGTGTKANDRMERKVMRNVFGERAREVPTSGLKSFTGHTLGAAGAIEAVASVLALVHQTIPPTANFDTEALTDDLDFVPNTPRPAPLDVVVSNNYAFGGNNLALVLRKPGTETGHEPFGAREVVISGLGPATATGVGVDEFAAALRDGRTGIARIGEFDPSPYQAQHGAEAPSLEHRTFAPRSVWRHMNRLSKIAIASARLAWEDSGLKLPKAQMDAVGLMFATAGGSAESSTGFDASVAADPNKPAVLSFSNVVLNATGGAVCQSMGWRGPTTTICHGSASASLAVDCAVETVRSGKADVVVVVAVDEFNEHTFKGRCASGDLSPSGVVRPYDRNRDGTAPGVGAVAIVIEAAEHCAARGGTPYAKLLASTHVGAARAEEPAEHASRCLSAILAAAGGPVDLVVGSANGGRDDVAEAMALTKVLPTALVTAPAAVTGDCGSASGAVNLAVAAMALRDKQVPGIVGLTEPEYGDRYVSGTRQEDVRTAVALTAAGGSVRGAVLLGAVS